MSPMRSTCTTLVLLLAAGIASGEGDGPRMSWDHVGYASLPDAAREAKVAGARILVGLSGSPH
jgi:hypothetical protein